MKVIRITITNTWVVRWPPGGRTCGPVAMVFTSITAFVKYAFGNYFWGYAGIDYFYC